MSKLKKLIDKILRGASDANVDFEDLRNLLKKLEFQERIRGDHHIFSRNDVEEIINLQPNRENKAKPYQIKQVRVIIIKYKLVGTLSEGAPTQDDDND